MPRAALRSATLAAVGALVLVTSPAAAELDPHVDPSLMLAGCASCHRGHGASRSPMLPASQKDLCLDCHGFRSDRERAIRQGRVAATATARLIGRALESPNSHPVSERAFSATETGRVACTSCHSPHRGNRDPSPRTAASGRPRRSPRDPDRFEYELCQSCHGSGGPTAGSPDDISRFLNPGNPSYHPVEAPARESSPSVLPSLTGREINCTDCHGNSDPRGGYGPHGSDEPHILLARYDSLDGSVESPAAYALCYRCHRREAVLDSQAFPEHRRHVVELRASCATCHTAHGAVENRALIRFGEESVVGAVAPSLESGRLTFVSQSPGTGACYLTCHGEDHAPAGYGGLEAVSGPPPLR